MNEEEIKPFLADEKQRLSTADPLSKNGERKLSKQRKNDKRSIFGTP